MELDLDPKIEKQIAKAIGERSETFVFEKNSEKTSWSPADLFLELYQ